MDNLKRLPIGADGRVQQPTLPEQNGDRTGQLDIPVESWDAYKTWCDRVRESGAGAVVLGDLGCMLNIEGRLRRMGDEQTLVLHVAEVLTWER